MVWPAIAGAGISSAASLAGGFLSRPDLSQRDLMWEQAKLSRKENRWQLLNLPSFQTAGLRRAGLNPMLAMMHGSVQGSAGNVPAAPQPYADPAGKGLSDAGNSFAAGIATAVDMYRAIADVDLKRRQTETERNRAEQVYEEAGLASAKTAVEHKRLGLLDAEEDLASARTLVERQNLQKRIVETAIAQQDLTSAERDAVLASIDIDMYESTVGEVARWLERIGFSPRGAVGVAHTLWSMFRKPVSRRR